MKTGEEIDREKVKESILIELGSYYIRFGSVYEKEPFIRSSSLSSNTQVINFQMNDEFPIDSSNKSFSLNNNAFSNVFANILQISDFSSDKPLFVFSSLPLDSPSCPDILDKLMDCDFSNDLPSYVCFGFSPVLSLMAAQNTLHPTGIVVEFGYKSSKFFLLLFYSYFIFVFFNLKF